MRVADAVEGVDELDHSHPIARRNLFGFEPIIIDDVIPGEGGRRRSAERLDWQLAPFGL